MYNMYNNNQNQTYNIYGYYILFMTKIYGSSPPIYNLTSFVVGIVKLMYTTTTTNYTILTPIYHIIKQHNETSLYHSKCGKLAFLFL